MQLDLTQVICMWKFTRNTQVFMQNPSQGSLPSKQIIQFIENPTFPSMMLFSFAPALTSPTLQHLVRNTLLPLQRYSHPRGATSHPNPRAPLPTQLAGAPIPIWMPPNSHPSRDQSTLPSQAAAGECPSLSPLSRSPDHASGRTHPAGMRKLSCRARTRCGFPELPWARSRRSERRGMDDTGSRPPWFTFALTSVSFGASTARFGKKDVFRAEGRGREGRGVRMSWR